MQVIAKLNYLRIAPRKVRLAADLIRWKSIEEAQTILNFTNKKAASSLLKLLKQAISNAKNNFQLDPSNLYISKVLVDEGQKYKRWRPRARGQAYEIQKKTSHITLILEEIEKKIKKVRAKKPHSEPVKAIERIPKSEESQKEVKEGEQVTSGAGKSPSTQAKLKPKIEIAKPKRAEGKKRMFRRMSF